MATAARPHVLWVGDLIEAHERSRRKSPSQLPAVAIDGDGFALQG